MTKWLWLGLIVACAVLLGGCGGTSSDLGVGEGSGVVAADGFDPFGNQGGPMNLMYFTLPASGTFELILSTGPDQPALPNPWVMVFDGHVNENNIDFLGAYNSGAGVLAENHGANIASVIVTANAGDVFTYAFSSWTRGTGAYSWRVTQL
ncbi:MAG: hypothetical protein WCP21_20785 [Armatimonadota bacterium]